MAQTVDDSTMTLRSLILVFIDCCPVHIVPTLKTCALGLVGVAGVGKTPVLHVVAMASSRSWCAEIDNTTLTPCLCTTPDRDFGRKERGIRERPDLLDDCDPSTLTPSRIPA